ncbi:alpha-amylase family glycosyl hydrolase [Dongia soli]|uniref:Alpha-amylase family glycosyl hydrolase n=1 Tax=Dongia soli TaxID=600628 RepID=A0ABU5EGY9_9PROT|nr:alpha-amylase family glycosyl hydrolase [Dongia soli]MDY0884631.1 alpha-amylase family glycosyl hydrolase [Dongia soli]
MSEVIWWKRGVIYQIYPRSYQDSNGDGIGDLNGIASRLDYLAGLGVDAIWISPFYPSPMADFGYDISDYCDVDPIFGTLQDFDRLVERAHGLGLKVILDFVPNHSSDQHPWFRESRSSRSNPKRDWYIWRDPAPDGGLPNNWVSNFGGSAWEFDASTGQYYYHAFLKEQPDLNWRNPEVREAMHEALRFWMRYGVDGFRVDVMWHLMKDEAFRDDPPNPGYREGWPDVQRVLQVNSADRPEVHEVVRGLRRVLDEFPDRVLIGEIYLPIERLVTYYGEDLSGAHLPFNFQLINAQWNAPTLASLIAEYEAALPPGGWPNWVLGNHDQKRIAARVGEEQARVAGMLLLTLRGTPTMYYGDELGIGAVTIPPDAVQDPWEKNEPGLGFNRDPQRTPMQWCPGEQAGFSSTKPWLPLSDHFREANVETLSKDPRSILSLYRALIAFRVQRPALRLGDLRLLPCGERVLAYERRLGDDRITVALNLSSEGQVVELSSRESHRVILSTYLDRQTEVATATVTLRPNEGIIIAA